MKKVLLLILISSSLFLQSQTKKIVYGINLGLAPRIYTKVKGGEFQDRSKYARLHLTLGGSADYNIYENFGIKSNLSLGLVFEESFLDIRDNSGYDYRIKGNDIITIQNDIYAKYAILGKYNKRSLYILGGFNNVFLISINNDNPRDEELARDFFKRYELKTSFGLGFRTSKKFAIETIAMIGLTNTINDVETSNFGIGINLMYNLN